MSTKADILQAKQAASARWLRKAASAHSVGLTRALTVASAVEATGSNLHAVGIGHKIVDEKETKTLCVRLYVVQKLPKSLISAKKLLPEEIDGIPTDVIESAPAFASAAKTKASALPSCTKRRKKRQRPVIAGISTAHFEVTAGTLSCFCRSTKKGDDPAEIYVMSNNHVYANVNQAKIGDLLYQPGPADGGTEPDAIASLHRWVKILFKKKPNRVDAAIGKIIEGVPHLPEICTIGKVKGVATATENMKVRKHGRTTGYTEGIVTDESYDAWVDMDHSGDPAKAALFEDQMRIESIDPKMAFGLGGDSGSLVVQKSSPKAVGLYFAGPGDGSYGVANHIADVLKELMIELA